MRNPGLMSRDEQIRLEARNGVRYEDLSRKYGISMARISQIITRYREGLTDDAFRELQRYRLEYAQDVAFSILKGPGKRIVSPGGTPVFEIDQDGNIDRTRPLYDEEIRIKAAGAVVSISERLSRSFALDRPKPRERDDSREVTEAMSYLQSKVSEVRELQARNQALTEQLSRYETGQIVNAEVVTEESAPDPAADPAQHPELPG